MAFKKVSFSGFRNLIDAEISLDSPEICLIGENAQGKTSFLELLYFLSYGTSFRTNKDKDLINWEKSTLIVKGEFEIPNEADANLKITLSEGEKKIKFCGKTITDRKILLKKLPLITFVHEDFQFSSGSPERRRWFVDQTLCLLDSGYLDLLRKYKIILKQRNFLLKTQNKKLLTHYTEQIVVIGMALIENRRQLIVNFGDVFTDLFAKISNLDYEISFLYKPSWGDSVNQQNIMDKYNKKLETELSMGLTTLGPHRDIFQFSAKSKDFSQFASTGQLRLLSLILRVAQAIYYYQISGRKPILLLDDVLLELDLTKRKKFMQNLPATEQCFYTFLPGEYPMKSLKNALVYKVKNGKLFE